MAFKLIEILSVLLCKNLVISNWQYVTTITIITLSIWVTHLLGYPGFFLSSRLTHLTQGNPLNISMFQTNPPNPPIFSKSQGNPAAGLP